jgi:D-sedoheptulose 7-phosphate isomerase
MRYFEKQPMKTFDDALQEAQTVLNTLHQFSSTVDQAVHLLVDAIEQGKKILICGNGGSACEAQHLAGELAGRYKTDRRALPAIALNTDGAVLTCIGNDYRFEHIFSRQIEALGQPDDLLIVFTTSGNSPNVIAALNAAQLLKMQSIAFLGRNGGHAKSLSGLCFVVPHQDTARIQEAHQFLLHCLVEEMEARLFHS